jgi:hypothetical protein
MPTQGGLRKVVQFLPRIRSAAPPASSIFRSTTHHNPNPTCLWHPPTTATPPPLEVGSPAAQQAPAAQANCHCVLYLDSLVVSIFSNEYEIALALTLTLTLTRPAYGTLPTSPSP